MDKYPTYHQTHEVSQTQQRDTTLIKSEDSLHSYRSSTGNNRRGCYKRRKTTHTWEKVSESQIEDGHQWRKYGQKAILNSKYSRNYYRCTYKFDQRCQATKQVQRTQEEPPLYRTTYYDHHTCKSLLNPSPPHTSILISFNNTFPTPTKQECPFLSSCFPSSFVNKECKEPTFGNSSRHVTLSSTLEYDHRDVMSDILYDSVELDNIFQHLLDFNNQGGISHGLNAACISCAREILVSGVAVFCGMCQRMH